MFDPRQKAAWLTLLAALILTVIPLTAPAQGCGGAMDHSAMMGGGAGQTMHGNMGSGPMGPGQGTPGHMQADPGHMQAGPVTGNPAPAVPPGTWTPGPAGPAPSQAPTDHHNH